MTRLTKGELRRVCRRQRMECFSCIIYSATNIKCPVYIPDENESVMPVDYPDSICHQLVDRIRREP